MKWVPKVRPIQDPVEVTSNVEAIVEVPIITSAPKLGVSRSASDHEGAWAAATKVARTSSKVQRSMSLHGSRFHVLEKEFTMLQEGLQMVLEDRLNLNPH